MTEADLQKLKEWFNDYARSFYSSNEDDQRNIDLKIEHTRHVCSNITEIGRGASLNENQMRVAEAIALFHDVGRFPQYARYKTFRDALSINHGLLGATTLIEEKVLDSLPHDEQHLITETVKFHNAFAIPAALTGESRLFLQLVRDADKVDIFRVFIEYYESPEDKRASATAFGVPNTSEYSDIMLSCILKKHVASYADIKTENDFRLMKLSWVYDMHFGDSIRLLHENDLIEKIIAKLPQTEDIRSAMAVLRQYISERLKSGK